MEKIIIENPVRHKNEKIFNSFFEHVIDNWQKFDAKLIKTYYSFYESNCKKPSLREMASDYDNATDYNKFIHGFDYHKFIDSAVKEDDDVKSNANNNEFEFKSRPEIEKLKTEDRNGKRSRDIKQAAIKYLTSFTNPQQSTNVDDQLTKDSRKLLEKLYIKLSHEKIVHDTFWEDSEKLEKIFGKTFVIQLKDAFSFPRKGVYISNWKEGAEYLKKLFHETEISDFNFGEISSDILLEFLLHSFHYYLAPRFFDIEKVYSISRDIETKFDFSWKTIMSEQSDYMRKECPNRHFNDLYLIALMSKKDIFSNKYHDLIKRIEYNYENIFSFIGAPLFLSIAKSDFDIFLQLYGCNPKTLVETKMINKKIIVETKQLYNNICNNIKTIYKKCLVICFVDSIIELFKSTSNHLVNKNAQDSSFNENKCVLEKSKIVEELSGIYPDVVKLYIQPKCRKIMTKKLGVELLGEVFLSHANRCVINTSKGYKVITLSDENASINMNDCEDNENEYF